MKKVFVFALSLAAIISCEKQAGLKLVEKTEGGCFLYDKGPHENSKAQQNDTVYYTLSADTIKMFVGFNSTCCGQFSADADLNGDQIIIKIISTQPGLCDCICYYTYDFTFAGVIKNYHYKVILDSNKTFSGEVTP